MALYGVKVKAAKPPKPAPARKLLWPKAAPKKSTSSKLYPGDKKHAT
jgi:hypothetical protein